jgi:hypothetical protein
MTRIVAAIIVLTIVVGIAAAFAQVGQPMPMVPYSQPGGSMLGLGGPMIPGNAGGGSGPTPPTSNALLANTGQPIYSVGTTPILVQ